MAFGQPGDIVGDHRAAGLDAAVIAIDRLGTIVRDGRGIVQPSTNVLVQRRLVARQRQNIVAAAVQDGLGGGALAVHRIGGHDPAFEVEQRQQPGQGRDLVAVAVDLVLAQHQTLLDRPSVDHVQRLAAILVLEAAPGRLPVDGDHPAAAGLRGVPGEGGDETAEAGLERVRIEQAKDPREGSVARNPALQAQKTAQERLLGASEHGHVDAGLGARQGRRQRDQQDLQQIVALGIARARVGQIAKTGPKSLHAATLRENQGGSTASTR